MAPRTATVVEHRQPAAAEPCVLTNLIVVSSACVDPPLEGRTVVGAHATTRGLIVIGVR